MLAMERMEETGKDLGREARGVRKPPTIRMEDIEMPHRKQNYLRAKWMYRKYQFLSSSMQVEQYCDVLWTNHSFAENIDLDHGVISREPNAKQSIKQKSNFVKPRLSMV
jgi:hypothetical protein